MARVATTIAPPRPAPGKPDWVRDGRDWPNREHSRFVRAGGIAWHVQRAGAGPTLLLLHGTGASTHSWRGLLPLLVAAGFDVIAVDLPGHGFTDTPSDAGLRLPGMAALIGLLLDALGARPSTIVGHSAGAAVACRMVLDGRAAPGAIVSLNGALLPFPGPGAALFPALARLLFVNPLVPRLFAWTLPGGEGTRRFLARATGSDTPGAYVRDYGTLFRHHGHVAGALGMMASWDLEPLRADLARLAVRIELVVGARDAAVPPDVATQVAALAPQSRFHTFPDLGHLAHEERPQAVADLVARVAEELPA